MSKTNHHQATCEAIVESRSEDSSRTVVTGFYLAVLLGLALTVIGCAALAQSSRQALGNAGGEATGKDQSRNMNDWRSLSFPGSFPALLRQDLERTWGELDTLTADDTPSYAIAVSERFLWLAETARAHSLSPDQKHWLAVRSRYARRIARAQDFGNRFVHWHRQYEEAETWTRAIAAAESIVGLLQENLASNEWGSDERFEFDALLEEWREKLDEARIEYRFRKQDIAERLTKVQADFIAEQAGQDLREAEELLRLQDRKSFNWRLFGRPRDNQELLLVAAQRSRRVLTEARVSPLAYAEAERLYEQAEGRLNRSMRQRLRNRRSLPPYQKNADYPSVSEEEVSLLADWRDFDLDSEDAHIQQPIDTPIPAQTAVEPAGASDNHKPIQDLVRIYFRLRYWPLPLGKI